MVSVGSVLATILQVFIYALLGRLIFDYVQMFSRTWRPRGILIYLVEAIYTITDKPIKFVSQYVPPLRLGAITLDLSFIVLFFGARILMGFVGNINF